MNKSNCEDFTDFIIPLLFNGSRGYRDSLILLLRSIALNEKNDGRSRLRAYNDQLVQNTGLEVFIEDESLKMIVCFVKKLLVEDSIKLFCYSDAYEEKYFKYENNGEEVCYKKDTNREEKKVRVAATTQYDFTVETFSKAMGIADLPTVSPLRL